MKKLSTSIVSMLLLMGGTTVMADPGDVITIPGGRNADKPVELMAENATIVNAEGHNSATLKAVTIDGEEVQSYDNFRSGDAIEFNLNNKKAIRYSISYRACTANDGNTLKFTFLNGNGEEEIVMERVVNKSGWSSFEPYEFELDQALTEGAKTLNIQFLCSTTQYTSNLASIVMTPIDENATKYTLETSVNPEEAGTVAVNPSKSSYDPGTEVTLTQTNNRGFKFVNWTDGAGTVLSTDATYTFTINANTKVVANFEAVELVNLIPTTDENPWDIAFAEIQGFHGAGIVNNAFDYALPGATAVYAIRSTQKAAYTMSFEAASANNGARLGVQILNGENELFNEDVSVENGGWGTWSPYMSSETPVLDEGDYTLILTFNSDGATTLNVRNIAFNLADSTVGIITVNAVDQQAGTLYNLQGQRVSGLTKGGIYIQNGRKFVVK